ncbi:hypothetical protein Moror_5783, partial [Moniliophthora roreri MCA 2997]
DMSTILSFLAADTAEKKLLRETNYDWERMSTVWSMFGMVGALRANVKIAASISGSERAGVELHGATGFTARRTAQSLCYWKVGRQNLNLMWRDSTNQLLSRLNASGSPWTQPLCLAVGYSRCPWDWTKWRCIEEALVPVLWALFTVIIATLPTLLLMPSLHRLSLLPTIAVGLRVVSAFLAGCLTPTLLHRLNSFGLAALTQLGDDRSQRAGLVKQGDHIVASTGIRHIIWQTPSTEVSPRSGDHWALRILCGFNAVAILVAYLSNYLLLGSASDARQYSWLGVQVFILALRYILWARRPVWFPQRPPCLLYIVCGSLGNPLNAECFDRIQNDTEHPKLDTVIIEFACASACSKQSNRGGFPPPRVKRDILLKLANVAPADLIYAEYITPGSHYDPAGENPMVIMRLPWSFVEELYLAQGIILGSNPWAFGGLYLGVILLDDRFVGLTTLHPFTEHAGQCTQEQCIADHARYKTHTITIDGYLVSDDTYGLVLRKFHEVEDSLVKWHEKFRENVEACRKTAKSNGPPHIEIRASSFGPVPQLSANVVRTEPHLTLEFVELAVKEAREKNHHDCDAWICEIHTFGHGNMRTPKSV